MWHTTFSNALQRQLRLTLTLTATKPGAFTIITHIRTSPSTPLIPTPTNKKQKNDLLVIQKMQSSAPWPQRRVRQPASVQQQDLTAVNIKRRKRARQLVEKQADTPPASSRPQRPQARDAHVQVNAAYSVCMQVAHRDHTCELNPLACAAVATQLYQAVIAGERHPSPRRPLFGGPNATATAGAGAAATAALHAKLCPSLNTTSSWTRVQRKLLPKHLFVLDAVLSVHLLQCLVRVQPLRVQISQAADAVSPTDDDNSSSNSSTSTAGDHPQQQQRQLALVQDAAPSLRTLAQLPTSIYSTIAGPPQLGSSMWPAEGHPTPAQASAAVTAAVAAGFTDAAAARAEFEVMLGAVYTVLGTGHKLAQWPASVLVKLLCCAGQLQLQHPVFLQVCCCVVLQRV